MKAAWAAIIAEDFLREVGVIRDKARKLSSGPSVPDAFWDIYNDLDSAIEVYERQEQGGDTRIVAKDAPSTDLVDLARKPSCLDCRWWKRGYRVQAQKKGEGWVSVWPDGERLMAGDCRCSSPVGSGPHHTFPITYEDDWCGRYAEVKP